MARVWEILPGGRVKRARNRQARQGLKLANSRAWPNYRATSAFRPIRDASAARR